jgi:hypothetical protein
VTGIKIYGAEASLSICPGSAILDVIGDQKYLIHDKTGEIIAIVAEETSAHLDKGIGEELRTWRIQ